MSGILMQCDDRYIQFARPLFELCLELCYGVFVVEGVAFSILLQRN